MCGTPRCKLLFSVSRLGVPWQLALRLELVMNTDAAACSVSMPDLLGRCYDSFHLVARAPRSMKAIAKAATMSRFVTAACWSASIMESLRPSEK